MNKKDFKVLMILSNSPMDTLIPPGMSILAARIKQAGYQFKLFDTTFYPTREKTGDDARYTTLQVKETCFADMGIFQKKTDIFQDLKKMVEEYEPNLIGLSTVEMTHKMGIELLRTVKGNIPTIVGGVHTTLSPEDVIREDCVDMICVGEGDDAIVELCNALCSGKNITKIKNLWIKKNEKIYRNPLRQLVNLDEVPFQDWTIYEKERFFKPMGGKIRITGSLEFNRGCPYNCTYCSNETLRKIYTGIGNYCRQKSVKRFIEEAKYLQRKWNLKYIYVVAESFLLISHERFMEFINEFGKLNILFWVQSRPEHVDKEKIRLLESIGCEAISLGIESGNYEIRKNVLNRNVRDEQIIKALILKKFKKIRNCANSIIGIPTETREQIFDTIELNRKTMADNIMIHLFNPYRGTKLRQMCVNMGLIKKESYSGDYRGDPILDQPQLSREEVLGLQRTFAMYVKFPKSMWNEIRICEKFDEEGNKKFKELSKVFTEKFLKK